MALIARMRARSVDAHRSVLNQEGATEALDVAVIYRVVRRIAGAERAIPVPLAATRYPARLTPQGGDPGATAQLSGSQSA